MQGNLNWVSSREHSLTHPVWNGREDEFLPICNQAESDSANLDHMAEYCVRTGVDASQTLMMLVPEAYQNHPTLLRKYPEVSTLADWRRLLSPIGFWCDCILNNKLRLFPVYQTSCLCHRAGDIPALLQTLLAARSAALRLLHCPPQ